MKGDVGYEKEIGGCRGKWVRKMCLLLKEELLPYVGLQLERMQS